MRPLTPFLICDLHTDYASFPFSFLLFLVREQLSLFFGVDLVSKKEFISVTIESILQGRM